MNKAASFIKKALKVFLWILISFLLVIIGITFLIRIPAIQTRLGYYTASFISKKTHTGVNISKINIAFPKSWAVEGLYLEDKQKDTLLYARQVKINLAIKNLFHKQIQVNSFILDGVNLHVNRTQTDSLFNYYFLQASFGDTSGNKTVRTKKKSNWTFGIQHINLKNIRLNYEDEYGGINASAAFSGIKLNVDKVDMGQSNYGIDELLIERLVTNILIKPGVKQKKNTGGVLPVITANRIQINNSKLRYGDSIVKKSMMTAINRFELRTASIDLQSQLVSLKSINLDNDSLTYSADKPEIRNAFDAAHLYYRHLMITASDFYYSPAKTGILIKKFTTVDQNNFAITKFETDFSMDRHSITAKRLIVSTSHSILDADVALQFTSLKSLMDSIPFMVLNVSVKNAVISNSDLLYFNPRLGKMPFFKIKRITTGITGNFNGPVRNLNGKKLVIKTGDNTVLMTDFNIRGLPSVQSAYFNFPNLVITSGKQDISRIADTLLPKNIDLPENISLRVAFEGKLKSFKSTMGMSSSYGSANLFATVDKNENFNGKLNITDFDLGRLMMNKDMLGPVSLLAETSGHGLDKQTLKAKIKAVVSNIYLNKYMYHNLNVDGDVTGQEFEGKINLDDENAAFVFNGLVNLNPGHEQYTFRFGIAGADLQKLNITKDDIRVALNAETDLKGGTVNEINGKAAISDIIIAHEGKKYRLDSLLLASINEPGKSELNVSSSLIGIKYNGTFAPAELPKVLRGFAEHYFPFSADSSDRSKDSGKPQDFSFEIQFSNHPILREVFFPQLKEFEPGIIKGKFNSRKNDLQINAEIKKIQYGALDIKDLAVVVNSNANALNYNISSANISNAQIKLDNFMAEGKLRDNIINTTLSSIDEKKNKKLLIRSQITKDESTYKLQLDPDDFYLMNDRWEIAADNYIEFGKKGFLIHHLFLNKGESQVHINSVNGLFHDDVNLMIKNFKLEDVSGILEKDTSLVKGNVDGNILLKSVNNTYGLITDAKISSLIVREVPIGNITIKAANPAAGKFNIDAVLTGAENDLSLNGYFGTEDQGKSLHFKTNIRALSMKTLQAVSMGSITDASGSLTGNFLIEGTTAEPLITGQLTFNNAMITPAVLNNPLQLKHETVKLKKDGLYFDSFTVLDANQHQAVIDGAVQMEKFKNLVFAVNLNTKDFQLLNTTAKDNKQFFGRMIIDSRIDVKGPLSLPVVTAKLKMKDGSNFTFAIPEKRLTTDKGEGVLEFEGSLNPILERDDNEKIQKSKLTQFDITSLIEIDNQATLRLLLDPSAPDSLVVRGDAALSFGLDRSGKITLTGTYYLNEGSYLVSLESLIKRKFDIKPGSKITWNGDPMDADVSINATHSVRASPIDLVADQISGVSETDKNAYKQQYPFLVLLKLRGAILKPEISFEIQLPPEDKGIFGGAVNAKLNMLGEDPSALNKQVFALLVLGRFVQENPFQTEAGGASMAVRTTVSKLLSDQLNRLGSKVMPGMELDIGVQSYDDYQTGQAEGRTQVDIGVKKRLLNDRLTVQVGGTVDVEGEKAKQNSASDLTSDFTLEYKLTKDGRFRLKGFRQNQYEGAIEGQLVETGAGLLYVRDFNKWKNFFKKPKNKSESSNDNAWINQK